MAGTLVLEADRYHLYVSFACPFAQRALVVRHLLKLEQALPITVVVPKIGPKDSDGIASWPIVASIDPSKPHCTPDPVFGARFMRQVFLACDPAYADRFSVPLLIDKKEKKIVSTDSLEIAKRLCNLKPLSPDEESKRTDLYPSDKQTEIDSLMSWIGPKICQGVYMAGFAQSQDSYHAASKAVFDHLDKAEGILSKSRFLTGDRLTVADVCLFTSLVRFDLVYAHLFKLVYRRISSNYPSLQGFLCDVFFTRDIGQETLVEKHIIEGFFGSATMAKVHPTQFVPYGLELNLDLETANERRQKCICMGWRFSSHPIPSH